MYNQTKRMMAIGGFCLISSIALSAQISLKLHNMEKPLNFDPFGHARFAHLFVLYD